MKAKKLIALILTLVLLAYAGAAFLLYDRADTASILCFAGSYAQQWAEKHHIPYETLADSEACLGVVKLESFDYNLENGKLVIKAYRGDSASLAIPMEIDGTPVAAVDEAAFDSCKNLTEVYIPETLQTYGPIHNTAVRVHTYENSPVHLQIIGAQRKLEENLSLVAKAGEAKAAADTADAQAQAAEDLAREAKEAADAEDAANKALEAEPQEGAEPSDKAQKDYEKLQKQAREARDNADAAKAMADELYIKTQGLDLREIAAQTTILDSYYVDFQNAEIPCAYNAVSDGLELVRYEPGAAEILVPSAIDGKAVTAISFPVLSAGVRTVLIPDTVQRIDSDFSSPRYDLPFMANLAVMVCAYAMALIVTAGMFGSSAALNKKFLGMSVAYTGVKYFILILIWAALSLILSFGWVLQVVVGLILLLLAIGESAMAKTAARTVSKLDTKAKVQTQFMRSLTDQLQNLCSAADPELQSDLEDLYEAARYADPVSCQEVARLEDQMRRTMAHLETAVSQKDMDGVRQAKSTLERLLRERSAICRQMK